MNLSFLLRITDQCQKYKASAIEICAALLSPQWHGFVSLLLRALTQWSVGRPSRTADVQAALEESRVYVMERKRDRNKRRLSTQGGKHFFLCTLPPYLPSITCLYVEFYAFCQFLCFPLRGAELLKGISMPITHNLSFPMLEQISN